MSRPYYQDDSVTIYHGDCREVMPLLPPHSVDMVITDPPFSVPVKYEDADGIHPRSWGDLLVMEPFFVDVFRQIKQTCKASAHVYVCCDADTYPVFYKAAYSLWPQSQMIVWYKPTGRRGRGWLHAFELVMHMRTPQTVYAEGFRQDVIGIMPVRTLNREHPAEKPGDLIDFLGDGFPGEGVFLDPFAGSGSGLALAKAHGWKAIGIEIEERYCELAARRCTQEVLDLGGAA